MRADEITPEQRLLLRAAGCRDLSSAKGAWTGFRRLVAEGDEDLKAQRLLPAVCRNLARLGDPRDPFLSRAYAVSVGASARVLEAAAEALRVLNAASIPALVLKGTALLVAHYRDLGMRPMSDADILVPEARITEALETLEASGWSGDPDRAWLKSGMHAGTLMNSTGSTLDLHRHALYEARYAEADDEFFARSIPVEVSGVPCRAMNAGAQLIHSIVHGLRWSIAPSNIWVLDAITILRSDAVDPVSTRAQAESLGFIVPLRRGIEIVRSVFGPQDALDALLLHLRRSPEGISARVEHWFRVSEPGGMTGALPNLWFAHLRSGPQGRIGFRSFPVFLAEVWGLRTVRQLPATLLRKALRRLRPDNR